MRSCTKKINIFAYAILVFAMVFSVSFAFFSPSFASAETGVPTPISYQGHLTDSGGNPLGGAGTPYFFKFSLWDSPTVGSGTKVWPTSNPNSTSLSVKQGVFNVNIGDTENGYPDALDYNWNSNKKVYLQVEISSDNSNFETLSPRSPINSTPFSQVASQVSGVGQSSFGTTTPFLNTLISAISTSINSAVLSIKGIAGQVANLFNIFDSNGNTLFTVSPSGNVGVGNAAPAERFEVNGNIKTSLVSANLIANGTFDADSSWAKGAGVTIADGVMHNNGTIGGYGAIATQSTGGATYGNTYSVTYTVKNYVSGTIQIVVGGYQSTAMRSGAGTYTDTITVTNPASNSSFYINNGSTANAVFDIDDVTVKKVTGGDMIAGGIFSGGGTAGIKVDSAGSVGIGTLLPVSLMEIQGGLTTTGSVLTLSSKETSTVLNDVLGRINFRAALDAAGTDAVLTGASISAIAENTFSSTVNETGLQFSTGASEVAVERMRIDHYGNVGIGTSTPSARLSILGLNTSTTTYSTNIMDASSTSIFRVRNDGRVFVGPSDVINSVSKLNVNGEAYISSNFVVGGTIFGNAGFSAGAGQSLRLSAYSAPYVYITNQWSNSTPMRFGIGTTTPSARLDVYGSAGSADIFAVSSSTNSRLFTIGASGNVGIGTTAPANKLDITSAIGSNSHFHFGQAANQGGYLTSLTDNQFTMSGGAEYVSGNWTARSSASSMVNNYNGNIYFRTNSGLTVGGSFTPSERMIIDTSGNVGIGTTTPTNKLDVWGNLSVGTSSTPALFVNTSYGSVGLGGVAVSNRKLLAYGDIESSSFILSPSMTTNNFNSYSGGSAAMNFNSAATGDILFKTGGITNLAIKNTGYVGIGTTTPRGILDVQPPNDGDVMYLGNPSKASAVQFVNGRYYSGSSAMQFVGANASNVAKPIWFGVANDTPLVVITTTGNVGIGTTTPSGKLSVSTTGDINALNVVNATGNVLIGTATDVTAYGGAKLQVKGGASAQGTWSGRIIAGGSTSVFLMGEIDSRAVLAGHNSALSVWNDLYINPVNSANTYIGNSGSWPTVKGSSTLSVVAGNVGIGTTTPSQKLSVVGNAQFTAVTSGTYGMDLNLTSDGTLTTSASDERLKQNILVLDSKETLDKIMQLKPSSFDWKSNSSHDIGLIAQEVESIFPELVFINPTDGYKGINYSRLPALLISAVQEIAKNIAGFAEEFRTKKLCVGETCITEGELKQLLQNKSIESAGGVNTTNTSIDTNTGTDTSTTGTDTNTDVDTNTGTDTNTDADTNTGTDTNTDADINDNSNVSPSSSGADLNSNNADNINSIGNIDANKDELPVGNTDTSQTDGVVGIGVI